MYYEKIEGGIYIQSWMSQFASSIIPPIKYLQEANRQSEHMIEQLEGKIDQEEGLEIVRVFIGGSNATHTTIIKTENNEFDVDIHVYLTGEGVESKHLRKFLRKKLIEIYPNKEKDDFITTKSSVQVIFRGGIQLNVDVVPVVHDTTRSGWWGYIPRPNDEKLWTSVPEHIEWVRSKTANSNPPVKFNKMVRIMKWWSKYQKLKTTNSFSISCLIGYSFENNIFSNNWHEALVQVFNHFVNCWKIKPEMDPKVWIKDPINSDNNAAKSWSLEGKIKFVEKANEAEQFIKSSYNAYIAGDKEEALQYLSDLFGPKFLEILS